MDSDRERGVIDSTADADVPLEQGKGKGKGRVGRTLINLNLAGSSASTSHHTHTRRRRTFLSIWTRKRCTSDRRLGKDGAINYRFVLAFMAVLIVVMISSLIVSAQRWWSTIKMFPNNANTHISNTTSEVKRISAASHNDEMQGDDALTLALSLGYGWIEVDTHLGPNASASCTTSAASSSSSNDKTNDDLDPCLTLLAGHEEKDLNSNRTLQSLYFDPIMQRLDENNQTENGTGKWVGVYKDDSDAEVVLMIDMKADGDAIWPYLEAALQPFLAKNYLTTYDTTTTKWTYGPLRIVGTGSTPIPRVYYSKYRYIFYDAPLVLLDKPFSIPASTSGPATTFEWDNTIAPIASSKYPIPYYLALTPSLPSGKKKERNPFMCKLKYHAAVAESKGIQSRWWGVARNPRWLRRKMWEIQYESGASVLNADDLQELAWWLNGKGTGDRDESFTC